MSDNSDRAATPILAFLVGGLLVSAVVLSFFLYNVQHQHVALNGPSHVAFNLKSHHNH
jgi:hypothetical protein